MRQKVRGDFLKPGRPMKTQRQMIREATRRAGLHRTKAQRRRFEQGMTRVLGYKPAKLSDFVTKPSRYAVKRRAVQYRVKTQTVPGKHIAVGYRINLWGERVPAYEYRSERTVVEKTPIGEKLTIKRLAKRGQGKGGGGGERGSRVTGSAVARKAAARLAARVGGKRGGRPKREKRKKKK